MIAKKLRILKKLIKEKDPYLWPKVRFALRMNALRLLYRFSRYKGDKVLEERWDHLIVLDACRYETFKRLNTLKGKLEQHHSTGSNTNEFLEGNFGEARDDIVYITGNPQVMLTSVGKDKGRFHHMEHVWDYGWSDRLGTTPPNAVSEAAVKMLRRFPDKRLVIHYMQPHIPYIGPSHLALSKELGKRKRLSAEELMDEAQFGKLTAKTLTEAYEENLKLVLFEVAKLLPSLKGRVVVTADHGELFGEHGIFFHPQGIYLEPLVTVPWLIINRKKPMKPRRTRKRAS